jgi:D-alanyl-D-alanine carboxypeptidase
MKKFLGVFLKSIVIILVLLVLVSAGKMMWFNHTMKNMSLEERLQYTLNRVTDDKTIYGTTVCVYSADNGFIWRGSSGNMNNDTQYSIASVTKMFTTALIMHLYEKGELNLDDPIVNYLSPDIMKGLHVFEGTDYSDKITIRQLLTHTSGLPDYFTEPTENLKSIEEIRKIEDISYGLDEILNRAKSLSPHFVPGTENQAYYSDTNFQLLGVIIENITGKKLSEIYSEQIFAPLHMDDTYLKTDDSEWGIAPIYYDGKALEVPKIVVSERSAGGIVSTAKDNMNFLTAFFAGELFPKEYLKDMQKWNDIFFPMKYGTGLMKCALPIPIRLPNYELIGHSGSTGTFCYYCPSRNIYITGTTNQLDTAKAMIVVYKLLICFNFK